MVRDKSDAVKLVKSAVDAVEEGDREVLEKLIREYIKDNITEDDKSGGIGLLEFALLGVARKPSTFEKANHFLTTYLEILAETYPEASERARTNYEKYGKHSLEKFYQRGEKE